MDGPPWLEPAQADQHRGGGSVRRGAVLGPEQVGGQGQGYAPGKLPRHPGSSRAGKQGSAALQARLEPAVQKGLCTQEPAHLAGRNAKNALKLLTELGGSAHSQPLAEGLE